MQHHAVQYNSCEINSAFINLIHVQFLLTLSVRCSFCFMLFAEVTVGGGGVLDSIISTTVAYILPSSILMERAKYQEH